MFELSHALQAILFVATEPLTLTELAQATNSTTELAQVAIEKLKSELKDSGLSVVEHDQSFRLVTAAKYAGIIKTFILGETRNDLSRAALETLAIIAYRGPVTKQAVETVRGVSSDTMIRNLLQRGLINKAGTASEPGQPLQYIVSHEFLQQFGLSSISELPQLNKIETQS